MKAGPRFLFFAGKGGVGKTTCAAAAAVALAERGARVLVVSTDPAHSLGDALGAKLGAAPRRLTVRRGALYAAELAADPALRRWLRARRPAFRAVAERGTYLDDEDIDRLLDLSLPGVDELVGLVELRRLAEGGTYDEVVVDTAPTGHTLRLLRMPEVLRRLAGVLDDMHAKHRYLFESLGRGYRPDFADEAIAAVDEEGRGLHELLRDPGRCAFRWVLLPEPLSVAETADGVGALAEMGAAVEELVVNRVTLPPDGSCVPCAARVRAERAALADLRGALPGRPVRLLPEAEAPVGVVGLRALGRRLLGRLSAAPAARAPASAGRAVHGGSAAPAARAPASAGRAVRVRRNAQPRAARARRAEAAPLASQLASRGLRLLVFGGKGGVGKTTCAVAAALALADMRPRRRVLLLSADPAHSLGDALDMAVGDQVVRVTDGSSRLWARELDADRAFRVRRDHYRTAVDDLFGSLLRGARVDAVYDRAVLHDLIDLAPPGLDELFALLTLGEALFAGAGRAPFDLVVLDTAPTGHTLRLLELPATALEWVHALLAILLKYREAVALGDLAADLLQTARGLKRLQALLRDPGGARFVVVTRAATLPRRETERLLVALGRLRMAVPAVVVDALTAGTCRRCRRAAAAEARELAALRGLRSRKRARWAMLLAPASFPPPRGVDALRRWSRTWEGASA